MDADAAYHRRLSTTALMIANGGGLGLGPTFLSKLAPHDPHQSMIAILLLICSAAYLIGMTAGFSFVVVVGLVMQAAVATVDTVLFRFGDPEAAGKEERKLSDHWTSSTFLIVGCIAFIFGTGFLAAAALALYVF